MLDPEHDRPAARRFGARLLVGVAAIASLVALALGGWWALSYRFDDLAFLGGGPGRWIVAPMPPRMTLRSAVELEATFRRSFDVAPRPADGKAVLLRARAFGRGRVSLNGRVLLEPREFGPRWKRTIEIDVGPLLRSTGNLLIVTVAQASGPPAINLALEPTRGGPLLQTDETWLVSLAGSSDRPARLATTHPAFDPRTPGAAERRVATALTQSLPALGLIGLLAAVGVGSVWWITGRVRRIAADRQAKLLRLAPLAVAGFWIALFAHNADLVPLNVGFDVRGHLAYVDRILEQGSLPLAPDFWQAYQPPLFYLLCAGGLALTRITTAQPESVYVLRGITLAAGIGQVLLLGAIARVLWPGRPSRWLLALGFAALLPMHLYGFHYVSNETLAMTLCTATSLLVLRLLLRTSPRQAPSFGGCTAVGVCLGLAVLAKFSALVLVPPVLAAVLFLCFRGRTRGSTAAFRFTTLVAAFLLVCGWHYGRVWIELGQPLVGNWDPESGFHWWQDPGFRTVADYLSFGRSLDVPWYGGLAGFADGIYSTLWGDGLGGGKAEILHGPPWNYRWMAAGYALALAPCVAIAIGGGAGIRRLVRGRISPGRLAAALYLTTVAVLVGAMTILMTLRVPSYAQSKAFYAQPAVPVLCVAFVLGADTLLRRARGRAGFVLRFAVLWLLAVWGLNSVASVWVVPDAPSTIAQRGYAALAGGRADEADEAFRDALARDDGLTVASLGLFRTSATLGRRQQALAAARQARETAPPVSTALTARACAALGAAELELGERNVAIDELRRAIAIEPGDDARVYELLASVLRDAGHGEDAVDVLRDGLMAFPDRTSFHLALGRLHLEQSAPHRAVEQLRHALRQDPEDSAIRAALMEASARIVPPASPETDDQEHDR